MVIRAAYKNTGFLHSDLFYQLEVLFTGSNPAGNLRELIAPLHALVDCISVAL